MTAATGVWEATSQFTLLLHIADCSFSHLFDSNTIEDSSWMNGEWIIY